MRALCCVILSAAVAAAAACAGAAKEGPASEGPAKEARSAEAPGCEESLRSAAKKVPRLAEPEPLSEHVAACIKDQWPAETRRCVATVRDRPDLVACMMRLEEQAGGGPEQASKEKQAGGRELQAGGREKPTDRKLQITGFEPDRGDADGGTYVLIKGNRFIADGPRAATVHFGSRQGTVVRFASDQQLIVQAPGGKPGEVVDLAITFEPGGTIVIPRAFTYVDKSSPPSPYE